MNHISDIDYKDFVKIYRNCNKEPINFLTIDTTVNKLFENFNQFLKNITIKERVKILDDIIKQNKADYDLYRQDAVASALSSERFKQI